MQPESAPPEKLRQIEALFHSALGVPASERPEFLQQACGGNEHLRQELESLLSAHEHTGDFLESTALAVAGEAYGLNN
jgi:hypothetical protein